MKIAHEIVLDRENQTLTIEGVEFDYYLRDTPQVEVLSGEDGDIAVVTLSVYADNVAIDGRHVASTMDLPKKLRATVESNWAKREADRIVHEGMADVLKWLSDAAVERYQGFPVRFMAGLPNGSQATTMSEYNPPEGDQAP